MLNIGPGEVLVILVIALVVLGPSRLPATARTLGRFLAKTRDVVNRFQQEMQAAADAPLEAIARERGRLSEPLNTPTETGARATDQASPADGPSPPGADESREAAEPATEHDGNPAGAQSDSEPEQPDAK
ncbi:MAG: Sec-independent protein translocase protein TatB [bacterium]|nr:Sec-independent protein translocase protein TatB [bacterium]